MELMKNFHEEPIKYKWIPDIVNEDKVRPMRGKIFHGIRVECSRFSWHVATVLIRVALLKLMHTRPSNWKFELVENVLFQFTVWWRIW